MFPKSFKRIVQLFPSLQVNPISLLLRNFCLPTSSLQSRATTSTLRLPMNKACRSKPLKALFVCNFTHLPVNQNYSSSPYIALPACQPRSPCAFISCLLNSFSLSSCHSLAFALFFHLAVINLLLRPSISLT